MFAYSSTNRYAHWYYMDAASFNISLGTDTQLLNAASRCMLCAGSLQR